MLLLLAGRPSRLHFHHSALRIGPARLLVRWGTTQRSYSSDTLIPRSSKENLMFHPTRLGLAALLVVGPACQPAPKTEAVTMGGESAAAPASLSAEDEAAVRALDAAWARAASAGDASAVAALYTSDATVLPPMEPIRQGEAAKKYWVDVTNGFSGPTELTTTAVGAGETWPTRLASIARP